MQFSLTITHRQRHDSCYIGVKNIYQCLIAGKTVSFRNLNKIHACEKAEIKLSLIRFVSINNRLPPQGGQITAAVDVLKDTE